MEITGIETYVVDVPLVDLDEGVDGIAPYTTNHGNLYSMERVLVRVDTDEGISGWGEVRVFLSPEATVSLIKEGIAPMVLGMSPFEIEAFRRRLFIEYTNVELFFAPIEIACWDIVGKATGRPVYELLGGWTAPESASRRHRQHQDEYDETNSVECAYCLGILDPETSAERAVEVRDAGYSVLKTKAGRDWRTDVDRIVAMHEAVDGELEFRLDPNQGWTLDQAVRVCAMLEDAGVYLQYVEQPIRVDGHGSLASLRNRTRQPIGANEDTYIPRNIGALAREDAVDVAILDMTPAGGIAGLRQQAAIAEDAGLSVTHHCAFDLGIRTAAVMHAVLGVPGFTLPPDTVYYGWEGDVITEPLTVADGCIELPDGPGLGVEVDMDAVAQYALDG
ncbi:mandelate racemase/muconate lactonizing enzyme family protein [Haloarchaeobius sp. HME9146]|uniref:mandelate racemase/muconate lactonizing enzyme family protein n=1 Tax=Haloarchaeobius sp. HME9146 TaxID=2978732 RepID=UPI0021C1081A|nr:mandelate racemase/muconate lactonizing enzyme family protein [Haloarchaeobius sp. HME9146]MCT9098043.1 mandelate racemase/muconate lactonizing enzyme family protein [Haloarchaeobius sp. HME9146]